MQEVSNACAESRSTVDVFRVGPTGSGGMADAGSFRTVRTLHEDTIADDAGWIARHLTRTKLGLALGAGGAKGLAHVGVIDVLERAGYTIDFVAGSSIGALVGALMGLRMDARRGREAGQAYLVAQACRAAAQFVARWYLCWPGTHSPDGQKQFRRPLSHRSKPSVEHRYCRFGDGRAHFPLRLAGSSSHPSGALHSRTGTSLPVWLSTACRRRVPDASSRQDRPRHGRRHCCFRESSEPADAGHLAQRGSSPARLPKGAISEPGPRRRDVDDASDRRQHP